MSRLMSVAMTTDAVIERRKTVTRRKGWWLDKKGRRIIKPGDTLTLCRKVQGRKPDEPLERLAEVEVIDVRREPLGLLCPSHNTKFDHHYATRELVAEGFPTIAPLTFINRYFVGAQGIACTEDVTRIEWRYVCGSGFCECGGCVL